MAQPQAIDVLVRRVARQIRQRRAEYNALRGAFWGSIAAALLLVAKAPLGPAAVAAAAALVAAGACAGGLSGALRRVTPVRAARLADRALGLDDRVATTREWAARPGSPPLVDVPLAGTSAPRAALPGARPDFSTFLKRGDDRLKLLEQMDRLPDLQTDFTTTQYKMIFRKSKSLLGGLSPDISPQKLRELLEEMERLGRKGGGWTGDAAEGMEALEGGQTDRALEAMQRALDKMRAQDEAQRSGKGLRGRREGERGGRGRRPAPRRRGPRRPGAGARLS